MRKSVKEIIATWTVNSFDENTEHREWIVEASDEELHEYILRQTRSETMRKMAISELANRRFKQSSKPHWTVLPSYRLLQISVGLTTVAIIITLLAWLFPRETQKEIQVSQPAPVNQSTSFYIPTPVSTPTNLPQTKTVTEQTIRVTCRRCLVSNQKEIFSACRLRCAK
jgi:hypothetical protein